MSRAWADGAFVDDGARVDPQPGLIETMWCDGERVPLWERHLARWRRSTAALALEVEPIADLAAIAVELLAREGISGGGVVRWVTGEATQSVTCRPRDRADAAVRLAVVETSLPGAALAEHKVTDRARYDVARAAAARAGADDALLVVADGGVLETAIANVVVELDGVAYTPPLDGRVLRGVARECLCEAGLVTADRTLSLADLEHATALVVTNAVHGPRPAGLGSRAFPRSAAVAAELGAAWRELLAGGPG